MSAPFAGTKTRVVGFLKGLFGKGNPSPTETPGDDVAYDYNEVMPVTGAQLKSPAPAAPRPSTNGHDHAAAPQKNGDTQRNTIHVAVPQTAAKPHGNGSNAHSTPIPIAIKHSNGNASPTTPGPIPIPASVPAPASGKYINLRLAGLVAALPLELRARVSKKDFGDYTVAVSLDTILSQLATGVVKIPFSTIRENAPQFFAPGKDGDQMMVALPLGEVLSQINPAQLAKPTNQVRLAADADITSPFEDKGNDANLEVTRSAPTRSITPEAVTPTPPRQGLVEIPKPAAPSANVPAPVRIQLPPKPAAPIPTAAPKQSPTPIPMPPAQAPATAPSAAAAPAPVVSPSPKITGAPALRLVAAPTAPATAPVAAPVAAPAATPPPAVVPAAAPAITSPTAPATVGTSGLSVALKGLVESWPEAVQKELREQNLLDGSVNLPLEAIAAQLKNGRVVFKWDLLRGWIVPQPGGVSAHPSEDLELPLKVIAPLFIGRKQTDGAKVQRLAADDSIPDVFAAPANAPAPAVVAAPTAPMAPVLTPVVELPPVTMMPQAIVNRAAALKGVAGALIALPDGLVVASRLPAGLSGDSLAAFLPQIYAKFDSCLKELQMGELNNLNFTAGDVPWRVFRTSTVFFSVFGRVNEPLPGDWLATLAEELEKK